MHEKEREREREREIERERERAERERDPIRESHSVAANQEQLYPRRLGFGLILKFQSTITAAIAQLAARRSHNPKVVSSILTGRILQKQASADQVHSIAKFTLRHCGKAFLSSLIIIISLLRDSNPRPPAY